MSKERLESLKRNKEWTEATGEKFYTVDKEDYEWLIEQTGRVQELENKYKLSEGDLYELIDRHKRTRKQNKRYREALVEIINARNHFYPTEYVFGVEGIARQALEGEEQ